MLHVDALRDDRDGAAGSDVYEYIMLEDGDLTVSVSAGDVVVHGPLDTCNLGISGRCIPSTIPGAMAGERYLIQVIGDDIRRRSSFGAGRSS